MAGLLELLEFLGGWPFLPVPTTLLGLSCNGGLGTKQRCHYTTCPYQHRDTMHLPCNLSREHMTFQVLALVLALAQVLVLTLVLVLVPALAQMLVLALAQVLVLVLAQVLVLALAQVLVLALVLGIPPQ